MRYFTIRKNPDGRDSHALMDRPPPRPTDCGVREFARRSRYIYLSEAAESLSLSRLIELHKAGQLEGSPQWTAPDPHQLIARDRPVIARTKKAAYRPASETTTT